VTADGRDGELPRARIVRAEAATRGAPLLAPGPSAAQRRRIGREELEARLAAERIVQEAQAQGEAIVARAREEAAAAAGAAQREASSNADAQLAARWLALRQAESRRLGDDADRVLAVAIALAERLVGATLELDPARIVPLAGAVLAEARGARRAVIHAHPLDAEVLRTQLIAGGLDVASVAVESDGTLARGALRLHTDVGVIDAQLTSRLDRLAEALRDALR
jgi:flagellar biosynthesis/type III secretory pathway protein FliH